MGQPFVLIDGYNLLHAAGLARRQYGPGDLHVCRQRLLQQLSAHLDETAASRTTVVFDAIGGDDDADRHQTIHGLSVVFAPAGTDADTELERLIAAHSAPRRLLVVSGDRRIRRAAQRRRCRSVDSHTFWSGLTGPGDPGDLSEPAVDRSDRRPPDTVFDTDYLSQLESELEDL